MMFYISGLDKNVPYDTDYNVVYLKTSENDSLQIYGQNAWWADWEVPEDNYKKYYLKPGMNIIRFNRSLDMELFGDTEVTTLDEQPIHLHKATIVFDKLSLVETALDDNGINVETLGLTKINATGAELISQINSLLSEQSKQFYFNCPISNDIAININKDETLMDYNIWYDANNINNQFVISEIDSNTFKDSINIIKSSKL